MLTFTAGNTTAMLYLALLLALLLATAELARSNDINNSAVHSSAASSCTRYAMSVELPAAAHSLLGTDQQPNLRQVSVVCRQLLLLLLLLGAAAADAKLQTLVQLHPCRIALAPPAPLISLLQLMVLLLDAMLCWCCC
jgi:hypothetical protein